MKPPFPPAKTPFEVEAPIWNLGNISSDALICQVQNKAGKALGESVELEDGLEPGQKETVRVKVPKGLAPAEVEIRLADQAIAAVESAEGVGGPDPKAANSFEQPASITAHPFDQVAIAEGGATALLPPLSVAAMTLSLR